MYICLQPSAGHGGIAPLAAVWTIRRRAERQSDPRPADQQMQRVRLCDHDQLRRVPGGDSKSKWLHARESCAASFL